MMLVKMADRIIMTMLMMMPAIASPLPLPPQFLALFTPMMEQISPTSGMKNAKIKYGIRNVRPPQRCCSWSAAAERAYRPGCRSRDRRRFVADVLSAFRTKHFSILPDKIIKVHSLYAFPSGKSRGKEKFVFRSASRVIGAWEAAFLPECASCGRRLLAVR